MTEQELKQKLITDTRIALQKHPAETFNILEKLFEAGRQDVIDNIGDYIEPNEGLEL